MEFFEAFLEIISTDITRFGKIIIVIFTPFVWAAPFAAQYINLCSTVVLPAGCAIRLGHKLSLLFVCKINWYFTLYYARPCGI